MNCFNRVNELLNEMTDDITYIKKTTFLYSLSK